MTLFEFTFGLTAVLLGLAMAEMAMRLQQLVFAGRRVRWAPEPVLLGAIVFLVIVVVWLSAWRGHGEAATTVWEVLLRLLTVMAPFMVAVAVFPSLGDSEQLDLRDYYDHHRRSLFGGLLIGRLVGLAYEFRTGDLSIQSVDAWAPWLSSIIPYALLMFIRQRWLNVAVLALVLVAFSVSIAGTRIAE